LGQSGIIPGSSWNETAPPDLEESVLDGAFQRVGVGEVALAGQAVVRQVHHAGGSSTSINDSTIHL
jgi:hypothetical protein